MRLDSTGLQAASVSTQETETVHEEVPMQVNGDNNGMAMSAAYKAARLQQQRNLAYCISQLQVSEKGVRKMVELIRYVTDHSLSLFLHVG